MIQHKKLPQKAADRLARRYGRKIQIGRVVYRIIWCEEINVNGVCAGFCDSVDHILYVDPKFDSVEATLLHEVFHGECQEGGFRQRNDWDANLEEMLCEVISQSIAHNFVFRKR